jgi:spore coat protein A, manganese oxidase
MTFQLDRANDKWQIAFRRIDKADHEINPLDNATQYTLMLQQVTHHFHPKLKNIPVFTYGTKSPGMLIEAKVGKPVRVNWLNRLEGKYLHDSTDPRKGLLALGIRQGMEEDHMLELSHNQVHLHGARVPWTSDGHPEQVFHPNEGRVYYYPNNQAAGTLWYHDHTMDVTRLNVYAGLYGVYVLRGPDEDSVLPHGRREIALVLQDKSFSDDGKQLYYEQIVGRPEFKGDYPVVNGRIWPTTTLKPLVYRLRLCNGANTRYFNLSLSAANNAAQTRPFYVIGNEGGFLSAPAEVSNLLIAPGERFDVLIDLRDAANKTLILRNDAGIPYSLGTTIEATDNCDELLQIKVENNTQSDSMPASLLNLILPTRVDPLPNDLTRNEFTAIDDAADAVPINILEADLSVGGREIKLRRFKLEEYQLLMSTLPGIRVPTVQINAADWNTAPPVAVTKDAIEVWEFQNTTPDSHPMHIHLVNFQVMSRTDLNVTVGNDPTSQDLPEPKTITGYAPNGRQAIAAFEQGWKDTANCHKNQATRLIMKFDGYLGDYVYHCHILEHEDMGMMYRIKVDV